MGLLGERREQGKGQRISYFSVTVTEQQEQGDLKKKAFNWLKFQRVRGCHGGAETGLIISSRPGFAGLGSCGLFCSVCSIPCVVSRVSALESWPGSLG